jgi:FtsP/CotA-like multicopper oxidase with cupredoxin domain
MMAPPIHLHGPAFQVVAIDGRPIQGAVRDTVLVTPMMGRVRIAFDADNPGRPAELCAVTPAKREDNDDSDLQAAIP